MKGSHIPCKSTTSITITPPLDIELRKVAMFAVANVLFLNRSRLNSGSGTRFSMNGNATSNAAPDTSEPITHGLPQPIGDAP